MGSGFAIGYVNAAVMMFLSSGGLLLFFDVKGYANSGMKKEKKATRFMGWLNIILGVSVYIGDWVWQR